MAVKLLLPMMVAIAVVSAITLFSRTRAGAGEVPAAYGYKVLPAIRHGNLTVFPVVAAAAHNTHEFLTLDEGLRSGEVIVTESGSVQPLLRRRMRPVISGGAQVNQLVLVNNSKRPLILLAGEIVTGGKQDRVIGKDRLVPAESDPIDLGVFCVEPGRWTATSAKFGAGLAGMAQPAVRAKAMADKDQGQVWSEVRRSQAVVVESLPAPAAAEVAGTSSYARVMENDEVQKKLDAMAAPVEREYRSLIQQLRDQRAVGVVAAVNGEIVWADIFASTDLLEKYWPKLARSYAAEAFVSPVKGRTADVSEAQAFIDNLEGRHANSETEPGLYRQSEITGDGFKAFELTSLLPGTGFELHIAKMAE